MIRPGADDSMRSFLRVTPPFASLLLFAGRCACSTTAVKTANAQEARAADSFDGAKAGDAKEIAGIQLRWCPAGTFMMGSPRDELERRPGEDQVEVTLSHGFWMGAYEVSQGEWKRVMGAL